MGFLRLRTALLAGGTVVLAACGLPSAGDLGGPADGGGSGAGDTGLGHESNDAAAHDSTARADGPSIHVAPDAGAREAGQGDTETGDAGPLDSGIDAGLHDASNEDVGTVDARSDASPDAGCDNASCPTPPANWSIVAFATSRSSACPAGFTTDDVLEDPTVGTGCTCGTTCTTPTVDCTNITIATTEGTGCASAGASVMVGAACKNIGTSNFGGPAAGVTATTLTPGCKAPDPTADPSGVVAQEDRVCQLAATACQAPACSPSLAAPFETCLLADGDQACPPSTPTKHAVGASPQLTCGTCPCNASVACVGTLSFFPATNCGGTGVPIATGACVPETNTTPVDSVRWAPGTPALTCSVGTPMGATVAFGTKQTVCCP